MKDNQKGIITAVNATGEMGRRIRDMGIVPGSEVSIQGRAPLYDPVALRIMGFTLTLRNNEADHIMVDVYPESGLTPVKSDNILEDTKMQFSIKEV